MPESPCPDSATLAQQLEHISEREARLRLKVAERFLVLDTQIKAYRKRAEELSLELGERNTYIHQLHLQAEAANETVHELRRRNTYIHELHAQAQEARQREQQLHADIAHFMQELARKEDELDTVREQLRRVKQSWSWTLSTPLRRLEKWLGRPGSTPRARALAPSAPFVYYFKSSPFRLYRAGAFTFVGWVYLPDGRPLDSIRARVDGRDFIGTYGIEEPELDRSRMPAPAANPGFQVTIDLSPGRHGFALEARVAGGEWLQVLATPIWCIPA